MVILRSLSSIMVSMRTRAVAAYICLENFDFQVLFLPYHLNASFTPRKCFFLQFEALFYATKQMGCSLYRASVWFENKRGGWGGWVGGGPLSLSPGSATALAFYYEPVFLLCITILLGTKICA